MSFQSFIDTHLKLLAEGDAGRMVDNDYHEDAVMVLLVEPGGQVIRGKDALKGQLGYYLQNIYRGFVSMQKLCMTEDSIVLEATINTVNGESKVWDAMHMKDGKILRHYSGVR